MPAQIIWTQGQLEAFLAAERELRNGMLRVAPKDLAHDLALFLKQVSLAGVNLRGDDLRAALDSFAALLSRPPIEGVTAIEQNGLWVRAACRAGLLPDVRETDVENLSPVEVREYAEQIGGRFLEATTTPKN